MVDVPGDEVQDPAGRALIVHPLIGESFSSDGGGAGPRFL